MDRCECYKYGKRFECRYSEHGKPYGIMVDYNYCSGTKECEVCSCGGNKIKCDFYPQVKKKALYELKGIKTNADKIRSMTDEELAQLMDNSLNYFNCDMCEFYVPHCNGEHCQEYILKWLKSEIK